jgi:CBS domain-containing protein
MDGGRVLRAAIWYLKSDLDYATDIAGKLGAFLGVAMIGLGFVSVLGGAGFSGFWLILIGFFVLNSSRGAVEMRRTERALSGRTVGELMSRNPVTADEGLMLSDLVDAVMLAHNVGFVPVLRGDHLLGVVDRAALMTVARATWPTTPVGDVVMRADATNTISPDIAVEDVLALMQSGGQRKFLVAQDGRLVGVLSLSDVAHFIALEASLSR